ncbi:HIT domain-containing protein [Solwaraspora sp. WMMA2101]|uniref:HIT domain-containing protein n=1 Tax=Solwaraspora sp. WMMA2101 TaxID=3404124 RepID=UPI003B94A759
MTGSSACDGDELCDEFRPGGGDTFAAVYQGDPPSRTIASVPGLRLVADLSPLVVGHLLLLPERHHLSFGHLDAEPIAQVRAVVERLRPRYVATFGQMAIMEHGSSTTTPSGCITHAHWHVLPVNGSRLAEMITRDGLSAIRLPDCTALRSFAETDRPYYYCADGDNHVAFEAHHRIRSQYLRSVAGTLLGIPEPEWDWSLVVRRHLLRATMTATAGWHQQLTDQGGGVGPVASLRAGVRDLR